jgi:hypothetical protein
LANAHLIMMSTTHAMLAAYLAKDKGDMLKDVRQSSRRGPKMTNWVEENKEKLRRNLAHARWYIDKVGGIW